MEKEAPKADNFDESKYLIQRPNDTFWIISSILFAFSVYLYVRVCVDVLMLNSLSNKILSKMNSFVSLEHSPIGVFIDIQYFKPSNA